MFAKTLAPLLAVLLVGGAAFTALAADPHLLEGIVVSASGGKLVMKDTAGKENTFTVEPETKVTVNGKPGKLEDLQTGVRIRVMVSAEGKMLTVGTIDDMKQLFRLY